MRRIILYPRIQQTQLLSESMVAFYAFEGNPIDSHVNGYNGVNTNMLYTTNGIVGQAANFENSATIRHIRVPNQTDFSFTDGSSDIPFTISCWVRFAAFSSIANSLLVKRDTNPEWQLDRRADTGFIRLVLANQGVGGSSLSISSDAAYNTLNQWLHIVVTYDGTNYMMFLDGVQQTGVNNIDAGYTAMNFTNSQVRMGMGGYALTNANIKHRGLLDQTAFYKGQGATPAQVLALYNGGAGLNYSQTLLI